SKSLWELSDEPDHRIIAQWIVGQRQSSPITMVDQLVRLVFNAKGLTEQTWKKKQKASRFGSLHPAARTFQTLRILVNDELGSLKKLLEKAPACLKPNGRIAIISFHSGEDNLVKSAFETGLQDGTYQSISEKAIKPTMREIQKNPRSASARLRYAVRGQ
ncbi:MAG: 16S rRNA (cytosine(1402)-N(4))-methyltransferase, partial [Anaerohalosphaera sp.]|nr:16S rRNA (cytosine(1402)-N(4))-methyltransferase [Anaerohalosphaera sp.]